MLFNVFNKRTVLRSGEYIVSCLLRTVNNRVKEKPRHMVVEGSVKLKHIERGGNRDQKPPIKNTKGIPASISVKFHFREYTRVYDGTYNFVSSLHSLCDSKTLFKRSNNTRLFWKTSGHLLGHTWISFSSFQRYLKKKNKIKGQKKIKNK